jgi:hypothetical protein
LRHKVFEVIVRLFTITCGTRVLYALVRLMFIWKGVAARLPRALTLTFAWFPVWLLALYALYTCVALLDTGACALALAVFGVLCYVSGTTRPVVVRSDESPPRYISLACWARVVHYAYVAVTGLPALLVTSAQPDAITAGGTMPHAAVMTVYAVLVYSALSVLDALAFWQQEGVLANINGCCSAVSVLATLEKALHHALTLSLLAASVLAGTANMGSAIYVLYTVTSLPLYIRTIVREQGRPNTNVLDAVFAFGWLVLRMPGTLAWTVAVYNTHANGDNLCAHALLVLNAMNLFWSGKLCATLYSKFYKKATATTNDDRKLA